MSYEAGSKECRHLIEAKESLLSAMDALSNINSTDLIQIQIKNLQKARKDADNRKRLNQPPIIVIHTNTILVSKLIFYFFTLLSDNKSSNASSCACTLCLIKIGTNL